MALDDSKSNPEAIFYINLHGAGTRANDSAEYNGFKQIFGESMPYISSMKGYTGHNLGAVASTELALTLIGAEDNVLLRFYNF